jgi:histidinol-phosphate aminotransferase
VVFVANPNNPTGSYMDRAELERLHAGLPGDVLLVIDQAYAEYVEPAADDGGFALARAHANVLVTRTFSKIYGLAGERVGWATGAAPLIATLNRIRGPFNVTNSAQAMALAALGDQDFVAHTRDHTRSERARFAGALSALGNHGIRVLPSEANFVLILFEGRLSAEAALAGIADAGYAVRWLPSQGLPHALRITIGLRHEMDAIAAALRDLAETAQ